MVSTCKSEYFQLICSQFKVNINQSCDMSANEALESF